MAGTEERIEEALIGQLSEGGRTDVSAVCARAGVSRNTFYEHYRGSADLRKKVSERLVAGLREGTAPFLDPYGDGIDVGSYLGASLDYIRGHSRKFAALLSDGDSTFSRVWREGILADLHRAVPCDADPMVLEILSYSAIGGLSYMVRSGDYSSVSTVQGIMEACIGRVSGDGITEPVRV